MNKNQINTKFKISNNSYQISTKQENTNQFLNCQDLKTSIKQISSQCKIFNGYEKIMEKISFQILNPPLIIDFNDFFFNKIKMISNYKGNDTILNVKDCELLSKLLKYNFQSETEYVNKFYANYQDNDYFKVILLSNIYKIFINNLLLNNSLKLTCYDFLCMKNLICSDFPKKIIENICEIYFLISHKEINLIDNKGEYVLNPYFYNNLFFQEINLADFFTVYCISYLNYDFLMFIRSHFIFEKHSDEEMKDQENEFLNQIKDHDQDYNDMNFINNSDKEINKELEKNEDSEIVKKNLQEKDEISKETYFENKPKQENDILKTDLNNNDNELKNENIELVKVNSELNTNKSEYKDDQQYQTQTLTNINTDNDILINKQNIKENINMDTNHIDKNVKNDKISNLIENLSNIDGLKPEIINIKEKCELKDKFLNQNSSYSSILANNNIYLENSIKNRLVYRNISITTFLNHLKNSQELKSLLNNSQLFIRILETLFMIWLNNKDISGKIIDISSINENSCKKIKSIKEFFIKEKRLPSITILESETILREIDFKFSIIDFYRFFISNKNNILCCLNFDKQLNNIEHIITNIIEKE